MNIQLTQQTLACFTALLLNILYPRPCLHVFMNSREQRCLLKFPVKGRLKCWEGGARQPTLFLMNFLRRVVGDEAGRVQRWGAQRGQGLALRLHSRSRVQKSWVVPTD